MERGLVNALSLLKSSIYRLKIVRAIDDNTLMPSEIAAKTKIRLNHISMFLKELREWVGNIKSTTLRTLITAIVVAVIGLIAGGFILWSKKNIGH